MTDFSTPEAKLMQSIRVKWGASIAAACASSSVPESFVAALIANESGGNAQAQCFETAVFGKILTVCAGKAAAYHPTGSKRPMGAQDFLDYLSRGGIPTFISGLRGAVNLSTSFGLTQIMGWHCVELFKPEALDTLLSDRGNIYFALTLLVVFANEYNLDVTKDFEDLFHCWNTGEPDFADAHPTSDPNYITNGMARMNLYKAIVAQESASTSQPGGIQ